MSPIHDLILTEIERAGGKINHLELAKNLHTTRKSINPLLDELEEQKIIESIIPNGRKYYYLTQDEPTLGNIVNEFSSQISFKSKNAIDVYDSKHHNTNNNNISNRNNVVSFQETTMAFSENSLRLVTPDNEIALNYWNSLDFTVTHRSNSKIYKQASKDLAELFNGTFFAYRTNIDPYGKYRDTVFSIDDFKKALENQRLSLFEHDYKPVDKERAQKVFKKITLSKWLYNSYHAKSKSLFLQFLVNGPEKVQAKYKDVECKWKKKLNFYLGDYAEKHYKGNIDKIPQLDIINIKHGINELMRHWMLQSKEQRGFHNNVYGPITNTLFEFIYEKFPPPRYNTSILKQPWFWKEWQLYLFDTGLIDSAEES